jgi:translation initiation factor 2 beta subunit (eIF-2beta)/eIF-5
MQGLEKLKSAYDEVRKQMRSMRMPSSRRTSSADSNTRHEELKYDIMSEEKVDTSFFIKLVSYSVKSTRKSILGFHGTFFSSIMQQAVLYILFCEQLITFFRIICIGIDVLIYIPSLLVIYF